MSAEVGAAARAGSSTARLTLQGYEWSAFRQAASGKRQAVILISRYTSVFHPESGLGLTEGSSDEELDHSRREVTCGS